jgi:P27 family predicted phage terminase small subunit
MPRGRRPTPAHILKLRGTHRSDRHAGPEPPPIPASKPIAPPSWLTKEAKAEWKRVLPELIQFVGLAKIDRACLTAYCAAWAEFHRMAKIVEREGEYYLNSKDEPRLHPAVKARNDSRSAMLKYMRELGLTPSGRTGLHRAVRPPAASAPPPPAGSEAEGRFFA